MTYIFYLLGLLCVGAGIAWTVIVMQQPVTDPGLVTSVVTAKLLLASPALGAIGFGLMLLGFGGIMARLDSINRYARLADRRAKAEQ